MNAEEVLRLVTAVEREKGIERAVVFESLEQAIAAALKRKLGAREEDIHVSIDRASGEMIATEAGAEGINLQFCALVVNYDLPWNPQRIEQRIGRCHRYGQKNDVVVAIS